MQLPDDPVVRAVWLAAVVDCEGSICVSAEGRRGRAGWAYSVRPMVSASQNDRRLTDLCTEITGVGYVGKGRATYTGNLHYYWRVRGWDVTGRVLRQILPYLLVKADRGTELLAIITKYELMMTAPLRYATHARRRLPNRGTVDVMRALLPWMEKHQPDTAALGVCLAAIERFNAGAG